MDRCWFEIVLSLCAFFKLALRFIFLVDIPQSVIILDAPDHFGGKLVGVIPQPSDSREISTYAAGSSLVEQSNKLSR